MPQNKTEVRMFENKLSANAIVADAADLGIVSRPRVFWTRISWQEVSNLQSSPTEIRWSQYQSLPKAAFGRRRTDRSTIDTHGWQWPTNITDEKRVLPCFTAPRTRQVDRCHIRAKDEWTARRMQDGSRTNGSSLHGTMRRAKCGLIPRISCTYRPQT